MTELKNNEVEVTLRYTGNDPAQAFKLARVALTFKGFSFPDQDLRQPVQYQTEGSEHTVTLIAVNQFLSDGTESNQGNQQPVSTMNNAPLVLSPERDNAEI